MELFFIIWKVITAKRLEERSSSNSGSCGGVIYIQSGKEKIIKSKTTNWQGELGVNYFVFITRLKSKK